jgi:superfamily I DNA and/or RNA helicase
VHSSELRTLGYAESLMGVLTEGQRRQYLERLTTQYRMHPSICKGVSDQFYDGELVADAQLQSRASPRQRLPVTWPLSGLPSAFVDCDYREKKERHGDISNTGEADAVMRTVKFLLRNGVAPHEIGVITFYTAQVQLLVELRSQLVKELPHVRELAEKLTISTVDGFQGDERDIILISCVRSVPSVGFLNDHRRINVAMSRAKHARWVFGNAQALRGSKSVFGNYFRWVNSAMDNSAAPRTEILCADALTL